MMNIRLTKWLREAEINIDEIIKIGSRPSN